MLKVKLLLMALPAALFLWVMAAAVIAQEEVPAPYAGLENPFAWDDASVRDSGQQIYQSSCLGCHGTDGSNIAEYDFSTADFTQGLEARADYYFWVVSEGRLQIGMPAYQSSFSEEKRWQVLTYLHSLALPEEAAPEPAETTSPPKEAPAGEVKETTGVKQNTLLMIAPEQITSGQSLFITAYLRDGEGNPIGNATVKFFIRVDFFTTGLIEIGQAETDERGAAVLQYTPRPTGDLELVSHFEEVEASVPLTVTVGDEPAYQAEAGITLPTSGQSIFIGPESAHALGEGGIAPTSAFRLPGGTLSWLLLIVLTVMLIWFTYFRVLHQLFRIPIVSEIKDTDTRLLPRTGMVIVVIIGIVLVLMLLTGPYSHFQLLP